jgi:hypothetical protein
MNWVNLIFIFQFQMIDGYIMIVDLNLPVSRIIKPQRCIEPILEERSSLNHGKSASLKCNLC